MSDVILFHPLANIFPLLEGEAFDELAADIKANGLEDMIVLHPDGTILDGRNRYRACVAAGVDARFEMFRGDDALAFVVSKNLKRRHLDESQRAFVAAKLSNLNWGQKAETSEQDTPIGVSQAAQSLNISRRSVERARVVRDKGVDELQHAVEQGKLAVSVAEKVAEMPAEKQRQIIADAGDDLSRKAATAVKQEHRDGRETQLGEKIRALPDKRFGLIYVDIPRHFNVHSDETGLDRSPENHYPTMSFAETLALPVSSIAADDCILVFWSTAASLLDDIDIMVEWGFVTLRPRTTRGSLVRDASGALVPAEEGNGRYCSMQVWDKVRMGLGYWFRDRHEFILVAARGNVVPPSPGTQDESLFSEPKKAHSAKPDRVAAMIDRLWPNIPKIELFRRGPARPGWDAWGNEAAASSEILDHHSEAAA